MSEVPQWQPKRITTIPAKPTPISLNTPLAKRRRVAAYARVSTNSDEQKTSYDAQVDYYTEYIRENAEWDFVYVYTDKGISGTSTKKREGFNDMMRDALDGKIDLIITKSVSRFARNTVDTLLAIRKLKDKGVEVYFEEQNIYTLDSKGEVLLTIMSSLAQDESRNISENVTWGQRKRFADGKVTMPYKQFLGYRKGVNGLPEIVEEEAAIIRRIYREFLQGKSPYMIANGLKADEIPTPSKRNTNWQQSVVRSILSNEKYKGDALLQKSFTVDFLTKKMKKNEGEVPQYYVEGSHPAIIDPEVFEQVQVEIERGDKSSYRVAASIFSSKLYCAACGSVYGSKVWHSTDQYRRIVWQCNAKFKNAAKCETPHLTEEEIKAAFVDAFNVSFTHRDEALADYKRILDELTDVSELQAQGDAAKEAHEAILQEMASAIHRNATMTLNQQEYAAQYDRLLEQAAVAKAKVDEAESLIAAKTKQKRKLLVFIHELECRTELLSEFDERLWTATVDKVIVGATEMVFCFKDGSQQAVKRKTA